MKKSSDDKVLKTILKQILKGIGISICGIGIMHIAAAFGIGSLGIVLACLTVHYGSKLINKIKLKNDTKVKGEQKKDKKEEKFFTRLKNKAKGLFNKKKKSEGKASEQKNIKKPNLTLSNIYRPKNKNVANRLKGKNISDNDAKKSSDSTEDEKTNHEVVQAEETKNNEVAIPINQKVQETRNNNVVEKVTTKDEPKKKGKVTFKDGFEQNRSNIGEYRNVWHNDDYNPNEKYEYKTKKQMRNDAVVTDYDANQNKSFEDACMAYYSTFNGKQSMVVLRKNGTTTLVEDPRLFENVYVNLAGAKSKNTNKYAVINDLMNAGLLRFVPNKMIYKIEQISTDTYLVRYTDGSVFQIFESSLDEYMTFMMDAYQMNESELVEFGLYRKLNQKSRVRK